MATRQGWSVLLALLIASAAVCCGQPADPPALTIGPTRVSLDDAGDTTPITGYAQIATYRSPIDNTDQSYGVYVPGKERPRGGYPVVLHAHGYGWSVNANFSAWQKDWADAKGWLLVQLNARGPQFYWGIGDIATKEVIDDLDQRFGIDRQRVYITGGSMGGTGAYRQGIAHPERIAAAVGVDGWTDFGEWHWHWYSRKDQPDDIEEFRRPLLEAASPLYWADRALWGDVYIIADALDNVVCPWQESDLYARFLDLKGSQRHTYDSGMTFNAGKGHGGGYDLPWIYNYFLTRAAQPQQRSFRIVTPLLEFGEMYWGRIDRFHFQGERAVLEAACPERTHGTPTVEVITGNLDTFTLYLPLSPVAEAPQVQVYVDGIPCYLGPARNLSFGSVRDVDDRLVGWEPVEDVPASAAGRYSASLAKTPDLCGPLGHAFLTAFRVCYGTIGPEQDQRRHRDEATAFAKGWNDFMVHGPGIEAVPEETLSEADLERTTLVVFGSLETSRLLRQAQACRPMPIEVHSDRIVVRDPLTGDREYLGRKFGAFVVYPNPLTEGRSYLVVCTGRYASKADGTELRGLEYDLEKLCWGYPDYLVFNTSQADLPHVMNVNNKPPVTCYEPGYFVEGGYFDQDWQPDRRLTLERLRRTKPDGVRLIHVAEVKVESTNQSLPVIPAVDGDPVDPPRTALSAPVLCATVKVVDSAGNPVRQARVTGRWVGLDSDAISRPTLTTGLAYFPYPATTWGTPLPRFQVLNVMATGAEYDFEADALPGSCWTSANGTLALLPKPQVQRIDGDVPVNVKLEIGNLSDKPALVLSNFVGPTGKATTPEEPLPLDPGKSAPRTIRWSPGGPLPSGRYRGLAQAWGEGEALQCPIEFQVVRPPSAPVRITSVSAKSIATDEAYQVKAKVRNLDTFGPITVQVVCTLVQGFRHLALQQATLGPGQALEFTWNPEPDEDPLPQGEYDARVTVLGAVGISETATFQVHASLD
jgi:pimeloyl-ACP methyl ester carboxylesterase